MVTTQKHYYPGMRTVKTAIAVFACMLLYEVLGRIGLNFVGVQNEFASIIIFFMNRNDPIYACVASIIAMQSTIEDSWEKGKARMLGTAIGGLIGLIVLYADIALYNREFTLFMVPLGVLFVIWFCNIIGRPNSTAFAAITLTIIMIAVDKYNLPAYQYAINRTVDTSIGVLIAMVVNLSLKKPNKIEQEEVNDD